MKPLRLQQINTLESANPLLVQPDFSVSCGALEIVSGPEEDLGERPVRQINSADLGLTMTVLVRDHIPPLQGETEAQHPRTNQSPLQARSGLIPSNSNVTFLERFQVAVAGLARVPPRSLATSATDNRHTADGTALSWRTL